jgi:hypothetical protein
MVSFVQMALPLLGQSMLFMAGVLAMQMHLSAAGLSEEQKPRWT